MCIKRISVSVLVFLTFSLLSGCLFSLPAEHLNKIDGNIACDFRAGKNAKTAVETIKTDAVFDKDRFVELFNEDAKYDPTYYKDHLNKLDLKIVAEEQPAEFEKIAASEVNFRAYFKNINRHVSLYRYNSKLYFFVLSMGGRSKPEEIGFYYKEVPDKMASYWNPIYDKVISDKASERQTQYGSFTVEKTYSHDRKYYAECKTSNTGMVTVWIYNEDDITVSSFRPCRKSDFWGICWENNSYNLWVQSGDVGYLCYSFNGEEWVHNIDAVKPDYIIGRH